MRPLNSFLRTPVAVIIDAQEWNARSLASLLATAGHAVVKAFDEAQALDLLGRFRPDVVFLALRLGEVDGIEVLKRVRERGLIDPTTPVIGTTPGRPSRAARLAALGGGAWDVVGLPFDGDDLLLRLGALVRAKQASDALRDDALVDPGTGLYSARGVLQRLTEYRSAAARRGGSMACIVVGPRGGARPPRHRPAAAVERIRQATRASDARGTLAGDLFVVVAPDTDREGALHLARRIVASSGGSDAAVAPEGWVAGLFAETDLAASSTPAADFLTRATEAFRSARSAGTPARVFDDPH